MVRPETGVRRGEATNNDESLFSTAGPAGNDGERYGTGRSQPPSPRVDEDFLPQRCVDFDAVRRAAVASEVGGEVRVETDPLSISRAITASGRPRTRPRHRVRRSRPPRLRSSPDAAEVSPRCWWLLLG